MLSLTAWILQLPHVYGYSVGWIIPWPAYGPFAIVALSMLILGVFLLTFRLEHVHTHGLHVRMTLPNPPEGRFLVGILSSIPDLTAEQIQIRIDVQNPLWGVRLQELRKWLRMTDMGGERVRVWGDRMFSLGLGYRVETFLEFTLTDFMHSYCSGSCYPPRIYYKPQVTAPLHIRLDVAAYDIPPSRVTWRVRKHYLLSPTLWDQESPPSNEAFGAVREWKLKEANLIGQQESD